MQIRQVWRSLSLRFRSNMATFSVHGFSCYFPEELPANAIQTICTVEQQQWCLVGNPRLTARSMTLLIQQDVCTSLAISPLSKPGFWESVLNCFHGSSQAEIVQVWWSCFSNNQRFLPSTCSLWYGGKIKMPSCIHWETNVHDQSRFEITRWKTSILYDGTSQS